MSSRCPAIASDPIPGYVNFTNGLYAWREDGLVAHTPAVLSTVQLAVDYDAEAVCPEFDGFLGEVLPQDMVGLAWEAIGYLQYSGNPLHKAIMLTGSGRNGKDTFLRTLTALIGRANITSVT